MRGTTHYLDTFKTTQTVGPQLLAEALYVARHGEQGAPDDLRPIVRELPELTPADEARDRLLVEAACRAVATETDGRGAPSQGRQELAAELDVHRNTVGKWIRGESQPGGPARQLMEQIVEEGS